MVKECLSKVEIKLLKISHVRILFLQFPCCSRDHKVSILMFLILIFLVKVNKLDIPAMCHIWLVRYVCSNV